MILTKHSFIFSNNNCNTDVKGNVLLHVVFKVILLS